MVPLSRLHPTLFLTAILAFTADATAQAQCPVNFLQCGTIATNSVQPGITLICSVGRASYDLARGVFVARASGLNDRTWSTGVLATDRYVCVGAPAGTNLVIVAELVVGGSTPGGCGPGGHYPSGRIEGALHYGGTFESAIAGAGAISCSPSTGCCNPGTSISQVLRRTIACVAGQPFELRFGLSAEAYEGVSEVSATLRFADLPAGVMVTSCQGYAQGAPVAANSTSWGRLKQIYR